MKRRQNQFQMLCSVQWKAAHPNRPQVVKKKKKGCRLFDTHMPATAGICLVLLHHARHTRQCLVAIAPLCVQMLLAPSNQLV
jgi:FixJ family two-component response regulator